MIERPYEDAAAKIAEAIRAFAKNPANLDNFESYLSIHFKSWMEKYANTPEDIAQEFANFAYME